MDVPGGPLQCWVRNKRSQRGHRPYRMSDTRQYHFQLKPIPQLPTHTGQVPAVINKMKINCPPYWHENCGDTEHNPFGLHVNQERKVLRFLCLRLNRLLSNRL